MIMNDLVCKEWWSNKKSHLDDVHIQDFTLNALLSYCPLSNSIDVFRTLLACDEELSLTDDEDQRNLSGGVKRAIENQRGYNIRFLTGDIRKVVSSILSIMLSPDSERCQKAVELHGSGQFHTRMVSRPAANSGEFMAMGRFLKKTYPKHKEEESSDDES